MDNPDLPVKNEVTSKGIKHVLPNGLVFFLTTLKGNNSIIQIDMRTKSSIPCDDGTEKDINNYQVCERSLSTTTSMHWNKNDTTFILMSEDKSLPIIELEKIVGSL